MTKKKEKLRPLTPQQEKFAQEIAKDKPYAEAYRIAYPASLKWTEKAQRNRASELAAHSGVVGRVKELQAEVQKKVLWDMESTVKVRLMALQMARTQEDPSVIVRIAESLDKITGIDRPERIDITTAGAPVTAPVIKYYTIEEIEGD